MAYKLFLDDIRNLTDKFNGSENPIYKSFGWITVRDGQSFKDCIERLGLPTFISFDNDLADFDSDGNETTGYDLAKWLCEYCMDNSLPFPDYHVHSANTVARENIIAYLTNFNKR